MLAGYSKSAEIATENESLMSLYRVCIESVLTLYQVRMGSLLSL